MGSFMDSRRSPLSKAVLNTSSIRRSRAGFYQPIPLINSGHKVLVKMLTNRLSKVVTTIEHENQTDFSPGKSKTCYIQYVCQLYGTIQCPCEAMATRIVVYLKVVLLDPIKSLNSVKWDYIRMVLGRMCFRETFVKWVKLLYKGANWKRVNKTSLAI